MFKDIFTRFLAVMILACAVAFPPEIYGNVLEKRVIFPKGKATVSHRGKLPLRSAYDSYFFPAKKGGGIMISDYERNVRQTEYRRDTHHRPNNNYEFNAQQPRDDSTGKSFQERVFSMFAQVSEDVMRGAVIGLIVATPCLRRLFCYIVLGAALIGATLMVVLISWLSSFR